MPNPAELASNGPRGLVRLLGRPLLVLLLPRIDVCTKEKLVLFLDGRKIASGSMLAR